MEMKIYAPEGIHEKVLEVMDGMERGALLDTPSGQGALSGKLEAMGFTVFSADLERENIIYRNGRNVQLDLNSPLPFGAGSFDYAICLEGIEHLENPHHLVKECARVLKIGGYLIVTTPNVMSIKSRLRYLFYSYLDFFRYFGPLPASAKHRIEEHEQSHLSPLFYGQARFIFENQGFRIDRIETNRPVRKWGLIYPLLKWFIRYKTGKRFPHDRFYVSDTLLDGEDLIFVAQRVQSLYNDSGVKQDGRIIAP
jgi:SAM-dependent methyltransferase